MSEISTNLTNVNSHYTSATSVNPPKNLVVSGPNAIPGKHLYNDIDAKNRIKQANNEIEAQSREFRKSPEKKFLKVFLAICAGILGVIGIKKFINFFK